MRIILRMERRGFTNLAHVVEREYILVTGKFEGSQVILCAPPRRELCPSFYVDRRPFYVPINWNPLQRIEDFIDAISIKRLQARTAKKLRQGKEGLFS